MTLEQDIAGWNQKSAEYLTSLYLKHSDQPHFTTQLIALIPTKNVQDGATWLLKHALEKGRTLLEADVDNLHSQLPLLTSWPSKLHVLQFIFKQPLKPSYVAGLDSFLRDCLQEKNKFVRAWAYGGFYALAQFDESYSAETHTLLQHALETEAPSVKARIRQLLN